MISSLYTAELEDWEMAPDLSLLLSAGGYFKKNLCFVSITNCNCFKVCLEEFQISFSFICTHIEIKYFNEVSLVNLHYLCFLYYLLAKKCLFMENLAKITTLNYCGSFFQCISLSFRRKKKKKEKCNSPAWVCLYWEKLCPQSWVLPLAVLSKTWGTVFPNTDLPPGK